MNPVSSAVPTSMGAPSIQGETGKFSFLPDFISNLPKWAMIASSVVAVAGIAFTLLTHAYVASIGFVILLPVSILGYFFMGDDGSIAEIEQSAGMLHNVNLQLEAENTKLKQESLQLAHTANQLRADNQFIEQTCNQLQGINQTFQARNTELLHTQQGMQNLINQLHDQNLKLETAVHDNQAAATRFQQQVEQSKLQNQALHEENQRLDQANLALKANTVVIQAKVNELQGYITQIQAETASFVKAQGELRRNIGLATTTATGMAGAGTKLGDASRKLQDATKNFDVMVNQDMQSLAIRVGEAQNAASTILDTLKGQNDVLGQDIIKMNGSIKKLEVIERQIQDSSEILAKLEAQKAAVMKDLETLTADFSAKQTLMQSTLAQIKIEEVNLTTITAQYAATVREVEANEQKLRDLASAIERASDILEQKIIALKALQAAAAGAV